jgi:radical SAM superfamily enzyme YgiQ (UPF0313 family)
LRSCERGEDFPIICAGGPCAANPEPMADFIDFFYIGDGEASLDEILNRYAAHKKTRGTRSRFLREIADIHGVYVPAFYDVSYNDFDGTLREFSPKFPFAPAKIKRAFLPRLEFFPETLLVPLIETTHARAVLELARGCKRGCRFCQAGFISPTTRTKCGGITGAGGENSRNNGIRGNFAAFVKCV